MSTTGITKPVVIMFVTKLKKILTLLKCPPQASQILIFFKKDALFLVESEFTDHGI